MKVRCALIQQLGSRPHTLCRLVPVRRDRQVVPLQSQPEAHFREHVLRFKALKGDNPGFCTMPLNPHGRWQDAGSSAAPDISFSIGLSDADEASAVRMSRVFQTCFFQPAWNADDLLKRSKAEGVESSVQGMLSHFLTTAEDERPGHNVTAQVGS